MRKPFESVVLTATLIGITMGMEPRVTLSVEEEREIAQALIAVFEKRLRPASSPKKRQAAHQAIDSIATRIGEQMPEFLSGGAEEYSGFRSQRTLATQLAEALPTAKSEFKQHRIRIQKSAAKAMRFPLPRDIAYGFGTRDLRPLNKQMAKLIAARTRARSGIEEYQLSPSTRLEALLLGCLPIQELSLAAIQRELDIDTTCDRFSSFLESWRNVGKQGEESFYEALDRTAGTPEAVFFFDAMLAEFTKKFGGSKSARKSLQAAHDDLHRGFLTYRQYRGLIEAVSYALLLPPQVPLPARLARYDYGEGGAVPADGVFYLRHQIDILLEWNRGDTAQVVAFIRKVLEQHPIPENFWSKEPYDPAFHVNQAIQQIRFDGGTDPLLRGHRDRATARAQKIRDLAVAGLSQIGVVRSTR